MKRQTMVVALLIAVASGMASAQDASAPTSKTREQVRAEVEQARRDGLLPYRRHDYPPSKATIERNKELYAIAHPNAVKTEGATAVPAK